jgi:hypothetical protein
MSRIACLSSRYRLRSSSSSCKFIMFREMINEKWSKDTLQISMRLEARVLMHHKRSHNADR